LSDTLPDRVSSLLGMFAKHWQPGKVKTRLARTLGESHAAMVHAFFVCALVERLQTAAGRRVLAFSPAAAEQAMGSIVKGRWELAVQADGDLGQRMELFFERALQSAERVVLIGSDSPDLPRAWLDEAFTALQTTDLVLGPSHDGGYYLVGIARRLPPIFSGIPWSTPAVWSQTTSRLQAAGTPWHELPAWYDVDDEPGLQALARRLAAADPIEPRLLQLERELGTLLGPQTRRTAKVER
jgi:uncharacterized protein